MVLCLRFLCLVFFNSLRSTAKVSEPEDGSVVGVADAVWKWKRRAAAIHNARYDVRADSGSPELTVRFRKTSRAISSY